MTTTLEIILVFLCLLTVSNGVVDGVFQRMILKRLDKMDARLAYLEKFLVIRGNDDHEA